MHVNYYSTTGKLWKILALCICTEESDSISKKFYSPILRLSKFYTTRKKREVAENRAPKDKGANSPCKAPAC